MRRDLEHGFWKFGVGLLTGLLFILVPLTALSQQTSAKYPEQGKVIGHGTTGHTTGAGGSWYTHTYKIETDKTVLVLDCGKKPFFTAGGTGEECGGEKKLQLGDEIHFRLDKNWVYIPVTRKSGQEQKLRVLGQELKPESK